MFGLHPADFLLLAAYLIGITLVGAWAARTVKNMGDFFMPRRFGKTFLAAHAFGTGMRWTPKVGPMVKLWL